MKTLTDNDLSELQALTYTLLGVIDKYSHVAEFLPKTLVNSLNTFTEKVANERERRGDYI